MSDENTPHLIEWTGDKIARFWSDWAKLPSRPWWSVACAEGVCRIIKPYVTVGGWYLDYGAGSGHLVKLVRKRFGRVSICQAYDPSFHGNFAPWSTSGMWDLITLCEVVEHIRPKQTESELRALRHLLSPWGVLVITTPNAENLAGALTCCPDCRGIFHPMQHLQSWNAITLTEAVKKCGFRVLRVVETDLTATGLWARAKRWTNRYVLRRKLWNPHLVVVARRGA